jgi:hypothetical protein
MVVFQGVVILQPLRHIYDTFVVITTHHVTKDAARETSIYL